MTLVIFSGTRFLIGYIVGVIIGGIIAAEMYPSKSQGYKWKRFKCAFFWPWYLAKGFVQLLFK